MRYGMDWAPYIPVAERRRKAEKLTAKLRKQGQALAPVVIEGRAIATTFWGKAWCSNLEAYRDYESRLPRGRSYARNGAVIDLQIAPGEVRALISGSEHLSDQRADPAATTAGLAAALRRLRRAHR